MGLRLRVEDSGSRLRDEGYKEEAGSILLAFWNLIS